MSAQHTCPRIAAFPQVRRPLRAVLRVVRMLAGPTAHRSPVRPAGVRSRVRVCVMRATYARETLALRVR